ncbi:MAG: SMI1/KNR4 family protein [Helicobacteraceae bacterium]|nr:SMI1/KNR4 family protein [Helicobacteraceae bacterium]
MAFEDFDLSGFWNDDYSQDYVEAYPSDELISSIEEEIGGYKLPASYIELMRLHNGGTPAKTAFPTNEPTGWAEDHIAITGIMGIGRKKRYSLCGELGGNFMKEEWGYPDIGVCIADTPSAGHEMIMLDYRKCGKTGEPEVVYVDQEADYEIVFLAKNFEEFIKGLVDEEVFDTSEEDKLNELKKVREGSFSPVLLKAFEIVKPILPDAPQRLRKLAELIVEEKGYFSLHADELSTLMYDVLFWLYSSYNTAKNFDYYTNNKKLFESSYGLPSYEMMIVFSIYGDPYGFRAGAYACGFVEDWWNKRVNSGELKEGADGFRLTPAAETKIVAAFKSKTNS